MDRVALERRDDRGAASYIRDLTTLITDRMKVMDGTTQWMLADELSWAFRRMSYDVRAPGTGSVWSRYSPERPMESFSEIYNGISLDSWEGKTVLDLGAGKHVPYSLSLLAILNGAEKCYVVEPEVTPDEERAHHAYSELLAAALEEPERFLLARDTDILGRIKLLMDHGGLKALGQGRGASAFSSGLVERYQGNVEELRLDDGEVDFVWSFSVLEHIKDLPGALERMYQFTRPGGRHFHTIDFSDHRRYIRPEKTAWSFLNEERYGGGENRLRYSEIREMATKAGFRILEYPIKLKMHPNTEREREEFSRIGNMPEEDKTTMIAHLILEKAN